jgi:hypothetical protein
MNNNGHNGHVGHEPNVGVHLLGVKDGPFTGEKIVHFTISGRTISAIVPEQFIMKKKSEVLLKVETFGKHDKGMTLIGIPGECFATTRRQWIPDKELFLESA